MLVSGVPLAVNIKNHNMSSSRISSMSPGWTRTPQVSAGEDGTRMDPHAEEDSQASAATYPNTTKSIRSTSFARIPRMEHPIEKEDAAIGQAGTFRGPALARRWVNTSRRNLMKQQGTQLSVKSLLSTGSERTPLNQPIPEDRAATDDDDGRFPSHGSIATHDTLTNMEITGSSEPTNIWKSFLNIWVGKYICVCLLAAPVALMAKYQNWSASWIFWLNFFVMLPLAAILGDFTEEAALHTNDVVGGLLNASFGNAVEVVVAIQALLANEERVVQASLIGSIYSNLLLVLGCCFFFGGLKYQEQRFNSISATASMALLALSSIAMVLPTPFAGTFWSCFLVQACSMNTITSFFV
jgi:Sodium/calcium exchanger protein